MSCHSIGHGLNSVSKKVLELYDEGKIEFSVAKDLLYTTRNAVHYCDGNTYEAIACFDGCRCARCLKKTNELYGLYDALDECREYYDIFSNKKNDLYSYNRYKAEMQSAVKSSGGYITNNDLIYILSKVIESHFTNSMKKLAFANCRWDLFKLYSAFLQRNIQHFGDEIIKKIALEFSDSIADIFRLYNFFLDHLNRVKAADDAELFKFNNAEGDFQLQHEIYTYKQINFLNKYSAVVLDGFLFFSDDQKQLIKDAITLGKQVIIITKHIEFLKENLYEPLAKELDIETEYIEIKPEIPIEKNNIAEVAEKLFTNDKVSGFEGIKFVEPFISRDYEFLYIARDISARLKALGGNLEKIKELISDITIVFGTDLSKRMDDVFKDEGIFILKDKAPDRTAPAIVYSRKEFLQWERSLSRTEKVRFFESNYSRLRLNTRKRSFILYPIGQYICEIYNIIDLSRKDIIT